MRRPALVLASASPRRAALLRLVGLPFVRRPVRIDERLEPGEPPRQAVLRLAREKARVALAVREETDRLVLACDTLVVRGDRVFGKPADPADARAMLESLSGGWHEVVTGIVLARTPAMLDARRATTAVRFARLTSDEIERYVAGREPLDKAGAWAIQGAGAWFVEEIRGSVTNVIGLPLELLRAMLADAGHPGPRLASFQ